MHNDSTPTDGTGGSEVDRDALVDQLGGDLETARELVTLFLKEWPWMVESVRRSVEAGSPPDLYFTAHALKGMVGNFSQGPAMQTSGMLEALGRAGSMEGSAELLIELEAQFRALGASLRRFLTDPAPPAEA